MELRVFWTDTARFQLEDIFNYYKDKASIRIARKLVKQIITDKESLTTTIPQIDADTLEFGPYTEGVYHRYDYPFW